MTVTTDPRTVTTGPCRVSATDPVKRDALIGRRALVSTYAHPEGLVGTIERIDGGQPIVRFDDGRWAFGGSTVQLVDGECPMCRYTSGHVSWCPRRDRQPLAQADLVRLAP
jgi:hypothetical protein